MVTIKRYSNRKLYDVEARRYVTLDDIGQAIRRGEDVVVKDHASGSDLTTLTLMQVIVEEEKRIGGLFPGALLTRFLRAGDHNWMELRQAARFLINPRQVANEEIRSRVQELSRRNSLTPEESERWLELLLDPDLTSLSADEQPSKAATLTDIQALLDALDQMSSSLDELKKEYPGK